METMRSALPHALDVTLVAMALGVALFALMTFLADRVRHPKTGGLALFMGVAVLDQIDSLLTLWHVYGPYLRFSALTIPLTLLYGPALYHYTSDMTGHRLTRRARRLTLGLPVLAGLGPAVALLVQPQTALAAYLAGRPMSDPAVARVVAGAATASVALFLVVTLACLAASWRLLDANIRHLRGLFSNIEGHAMAWLRRTILTLVLAWGMALLLPLLRVSGLSGPWQAPLGTAVSLCYIAALAYFGMRQQPVPPPEGAAAKYARSALDTDRMSRLSDKLTTAMEADLLHRDPTLSLRRLADHIGAPPNYVSQTLNDHLGMNFFDFVNAYRIREAVHLLRASERSVTDIALDVGFNARSTFNAAFRKHHGGAPSDLRRPI